ncbi:MAG TPA: SDR family NAD(P)-dependent oxidoreductase [Caulobacteraceae bacterium]
MRLLTFGHGFVADALARRLALEGWSTTATARDADKRALLGDRGIDAVDPADATALDEVVHGVDAVLVSAPPGERGCPGLAALAPALGRTRAYPDWIGYLSSTSVYGDLAGRWAFESSPLRGKSVQAARRTAAERDWLELGRGMGLTVAVFRLGAIYGSGRSALDRLPERTMVKPGQVFSRAHVDDIAAGLAASMVRPEPCAVYNVVDDEPSPAHEVTSYAAGLRGAPPPELVPFDDAGLSEEARRFWHECRRVSNARLKAELGWRPTYPSYREGLAAIASSSTAAASR